MKKKGKRNLEENSIDDEFFTPSNSSNGDWLERERLVPVLAKKMRKYFDGFAMDWQVLFGDDDLSIHFRHLVKVARENHQTLNVLR